MRGYHWLSNFKGADGNYYAEYGANRGDNKRYYSISEQKWLDNVHVSDMYCSNCQNEFKFMPSGFDNVCPSCGASYTSRYSSPVLQGATNNP